MNPTGNEPLQKLIILLEKSLLELQFDINWSIEKSASYLFLVSVAAHQSELESVFFFFFDNRFLQSAFNMSFSSV